MLLTLNNSKDVICDKLYLLDTNGILQDVLDLIANGGGGGSSGITTLTGSGAAVITGTSTSKNILVDLSMYSTTTQMNNLLAGKVDDGQVLTNVPLNALFSDTIYSKPSNEPISYITGLQAKLGAKQATLVAGANITISSTNTISATAGSNPLILQVGGVTQNATTLNFVQNNSLLSGGVLNVSRLNQYDKIPLIHPTHSSVTDLKQDASGGLAWGTDIMTTNSYLTSVLASYATTATLSNYTNTTALNTLLSAYINTTSLNTLFSA